MSEIYKELLNIIRAKWHQKSSLAIIILLAGLFLLQSFSAIDIKKLSLGEIIIIALVIAIICIFWFLSTRIPKAAKGKIGFAIALVTETKQQHEQLAKDFIVTLRELLYSSNFNYHFSFIELPQYYAKKIESLEDASLLLRSSRCHFMVYGRVRTRSIQGGECHILDLHGIVAHKPIPKSIGKEFSTEFAEIFPKQLTISKETDIFSFEFTARWIDLVARYVIGMSALLSGDINYALELFEDLAGKIRGIQTDLPAIIKIRQRVPTRLADIYLLQATLFYMDWKQTKNPDPLDSMNDRLENLQRIAPENHFGGILKSIWHFVRNRDIVAAKQELRKCRKLAKVAWRYNHAFLLAYEGNLDKALVEYRHAFRLSIDEPAILLDFEDFICWILEKEPEKVQLHFCLGLLNLFGKKDGARALQDFEKFLEATEPDQFPEERRLAEEYIQNIRGQLNV